MEEPAPGGMSDGGMPTTSSGDRGRCAVQGESNKVQETGDSLCLPRCKVLQLHARQRLFLKDFRSAALRVVEVG